MKNFFIGVAMSAVALGAGAQWAQEPTSVMGVELGGRREAIPPCPRGAAAFKSKTVCLESIAGNPAVGILWGLPLNFTRDGANVNFVDGRVQLITFAVSRDQNYQRLKATLAERYGPAHMVETAHVTANSGAVLSSEESTWGGPNVVIALSERSGSIDRSVVIFGYLPLGEKKRRDDARDAKSNASKL
ncbi:hypothetical protein [Variovorax sp. PDC80]|uniref:hypothetical protein n=1 Tax=Variovorax sp. PDC80 TaxID=1882827 RepID=UPI001160DD76|nr:hypothetical protein [Variovorax sp. PDC80]